MRVCSNGAPLISQPAADSFPPQGGSLGAKQNASPLSVSGVRRNNSIRPTVPPCLRPQNRPSLVTAVTGGPGIAFCRTERGGRVEVHSAFCILHSAFASGSGVVPAAKARRTLPASASLSGRILRLLLHRCRFDTGTISPGRRIVKVGN